MLKDVGMTVPKSKETCVNPLFYYGVTHVIIVACPHPLSCCIYTALIPCLAAYNYTALIPLCCCTYILHLFLYFLALSSLHPSTFYKKCLVNKGCREGYAGYCCCMPSSPVLLHIHCPCFSTFWH